MAFCALAAAPLLGVAAAKGPKALLGGMVAIGFELLLIFRPRLGLYALMVGGFWDYFYLSAGFALFGFGDLLTFALLPAWLVRLLVRRQPKYRPPPYLWLLLLHVGLAVVSLLMGVRPSAAYGSFVRNMTYLAAALAIVDIARDEEVLETMLWVIVGCAVSHALVAFTMDTGRRLSGIVEQPNLLAMLLSFGFVAAAGLLLQARRRLTQLLLAGCMAILALGILLTISRGAYISLFVALVWWGRRHRRALAAGAFMAVLVGVSVTQLTDRTNQIEQRLQMDDSSIDGRSETYRNALRVMTHNPWLGVGYGQFSELHESGIDVTAERGRGSHSFYLGAISSMGFPTALAFLGFVGLQGLLLWRRKRLAENTPGDAARRQQWLISVFQAMFIYHGLSLTVRGAGRVIEFAMLGLYIAAALLPVRVDEAAEGEPEAT